MIAQHTARGHAQGALVCIVLAHARLAGDAAFNPGPVLMAQSRLLKIPVQTDEYLAVGPLAGQVGKWILAAQAVWSGANLWHG